MLEITYKGQTFSWEGWQEDHRKFFESLASHNDFINHYLLDVGIYDKGYSSATDRLYALHELLGTAKFSLWNSYKKFYSDILYSKEYTGHLIRRSHYLKNAIVWYNSCEDYVYQIISLSYGLHDVDITGPEQYKTALKECCFFKVKEKLKKINSKASKQLLKVIKNYRFNDDVVYLRDNLANNLKHHGNLKFKGLAVGRPGAYTETDYKSGDIKYNSLWIESDIVDIDETIELIKRVHNLLINYVRTVIEFIDFKDCIPDEKSIIGQTTGWMKKEPSSYKKILYGHSLNKSSVNGKSQDRQVENLRS
ncbi:hypothetical protein [Priestia megaterium]|uniref:hypothetical protein n=1 Tax=Priestia megaterium TaxID=1404 RepID=UPI003009EE96